MDTNNIKVGSIIEIPIFTTDENDNLIESKKQVTINRISEHYVWYNYSGYQRVGINTLNNLISKNYYKLISI